jgi:hypothetical protein
MNRWRDIIDWVGGYPYEYASTEAIKDFYAQLGFQPERSPHRRSRLQRIRLCEGQRVNESGASRLAAASISQSG